MNQYIDRRRYHSTCINAVIIMIHVQACMSCIPIFYKHDKIKKSKKNVTGQFKKTGRIGLPFVELAQKFHLYGVNCSKHNFGQQITR